MGHPNTKPLIGSGVKTLALGTPGSAKGQAALWHKHHVRLRDCQTAAHSGDAGIYQITGSTRQHEYPALD